MEGATCWRDAAFTYDTQVDDAADFHLVGRDLALVIAVVVGAHRANLQRPRVGSRYPLRLEPMVADERVVADRQQMAITFPHPWHLNNNQVHGT